MDDGLLQLLHQDGWLAHGVYARLQAARPSAGSDAHEHPHGQGPSSIAGPPPLPHLELLRMNHRGWLRGALSVALDVRADELWGPLCAAVGGRAKEVRLLDVREPGRGVLELTVKWGELEERWELEDLYALVQNLNALLREDPQAKAVAILGEWEDMLQLWCVDKRELGRLLGRKYFAPRNRHALQELRGVRR